MFMKPRAIKSLATVKSFSLNQWNKVLSLSPPRTNFGWVYILIVALALLTRLWDLDARSLHYDEILHAWYSWVYSQGSGYFHTPLTHGPFLFHAGSLSFLLLGASDFTARLIPALFGVFLVGMPYFLRNEIGKTGSAFVSIYLLISPSIVYFSRFMRNDVYMAVWALALITIMIKYQQTPKFRLLLAWAIVWALAFSTKESTFLLAGTIGLILIFQTSTHLWQWLKGNRFLSEIGPAGDLLVVLATCSLPLWAPIVGIIQGIFGIVLVNPDPNDPRVIAGELIRSNAETGAPVGGSLYIAAFIVVVCIAFSIFIGLLWNKRLWPILAAAFSIIWLLLFTSFFTNWEGLFTGLWGSLGYWIAQQPVERASQPWYYYLLGLMVYESLALILALVGSAYLLIKHRTTFNITVIAWGILTLVLFTIAGEKMPWLLTGITLPLAIISGIVVDKILASTSPMKMRFQIYSAGLISFISIPPIFFYLILTPSPYSKWVLFLSLSFCLIGFLSLMFFVYQLKFTDKYSINSRSIFLMLTFSLICIWVLGIGINAARASFSYQSMENPKEILVYSQTGQETSYASRCINQINKERNQAIRILVDESDNFSWQWRWYLRDFDSVHYKPLNQEPQKINSYDVILMSKASEGAQRDHLSSYQIAGDLNHLWWFPNYAYGDISFAKLLKDFASSQGWQTLYNYQILRKIETPMQRSRGTVYFSEKFHDYIETCMER
tara:strand:+ start:13174 stop:15342 length:2169 start_codon:yes stop_codon:yes gene_type:complete